VIHSLFLLFRNYLTRQNVNIDASQPQDCDPMMTVKDRSIGPSLQAILLSDL
jgi:hypothetical protein